MPLFLRLEKTAKTGETVQESQRASFSTAENNGGNGITVQEARHATTPDLLQAGCFLTNLES